MSCLLSDAGIAIGLTSLPFRRELDFYQNEIADALFPSYKDAVFRNFTGEPTNNVLEFQQHFYKPVPYYLFGSFDLAVITLVDDFEMTARTFRPFDPMLSSARDKSYLENFFYKVITGPTPQFKRTDSIVDLASRSFLRDDRAPLFAMSLLKLNNALLIGTGTEFLREVVKFVKAQARRQMADNPAMQAIVLESHSAHEITLLIFTDSYASATKLITTVREARIYDLPKDIDSGVNLDALQSLSTDCLFMQLPEQQAEADEVNSQTLFADSESYFGFDFRFLEPQNRSNLTRIIENDSLNLVCQWSVRPGDLLTSMQELSQTAAGDVSISIGRGDLFVQSRELPTRVVIKQLLESLDEGSVPDNAIRRHTIPAVPLPGSAEVSGTPTRDVTKHLNKLRFTVDEIKTIQDSLRAVHSPKILTAKVLNAFTNFNDGILDPSLYGYFLELLPLMESLQQTVETWSASPVKPEVGKLSRTLEKVTNNFERAYRNRFHTSYRMGDVTDFNLDFKGGVQQLLTSFDAAYKAICSVLGNPDSFVYVAGSPGVYSTSYEVRLNYYHVFQPEIFGCIANHEAANSYLARFTPERAPAFAQDAGLFDETAPNKAILMQRIARLSEAAGLDEQRLMRFVTHRLFKSILVDLLALYFGYNRDMQLFSHWYWGYFIQNSAAYERKGKVDEIQFVGFMLRILWIERIAGVTTPNDIAFGESAVDELWSSWTPTLRSFLDWLFRDPHIQKWNHEVVTHVEARFRDVYSTNSDVPVEVICEQFERQAAIFREKLEAGKVCVYSKSHPESMFIFTEQLLYAYLSLLADRFGSDEILLRRGDRGQPSVRPSGSKALFDPIGGIFTHDADTRRERFRYRAALTMSLWDMAQKEKKEVVVNRLRRRTPLTAAAGS